MKRDFDMSCLPLQIGSAQPVTVAVIPAASFPNTLFPASKALPPALFPVLDADGLMKPAVLLLVEQAASYFAPRPRAIHASLAAHSRLTLQPIRALFTPRPHPIHASFLAVLL